MQFSDQTIDRIVAMTGIDREVVSECMSRLQVVAVGAPAVVTSGAVQADRLLTGDAP